MKKTRIKFWLLLLALLAANAYILLHRNDGYKYYPYKSVSELYVTDSTLYLKDMKFDKDDVELEFSLPLSNKGYSVQSDKRFNFIQAYQLPKANRFSLRLDTGFHEYKLVPADKTQKEIVVKIDHSFYNGIAQNEFIYCNLPGPQIKVSPLKTWQTDKGFSEEEKQKAIKLLKEKTAFNKDNSDFHNTLAIVKFASTLCNNAKGIHAYKLSELRPFGQINEAMKCNADLACGNYAAIVGYLFSCAGLPNRLVSFQGPAGNWQYGVHYYNEIYLKEQQQWVLVDAANKIALPFDSSTNKYLNAVDINHLIKLNSTTGKKTYTFIKDSIAIVPYGSINNQHVYYNQSNANISFMHGNADVSISPFRNFIEFYTFNRDVDYYSDVNRNDWCKIIIKELAAMLLILAFVLYFFAEVRYKMGKAK